jgi:hypothetical protein
MSQLPACVLSFVVMVLFSLPAEAVVVWRGDFESGDRSQWSSTQMVSGDRLEVVPSPVRQGSYGLRATVKQGDNPISSSGNRNELVYLSHEPSGSEYWYRWSTQFDVSYPSVKTWQLFMQWHHEGSTGSPPLEFYVYGEEIRLRVGGSGGKLLWIGKLNRGVWNDFVLHVKWSSDPTVGFVELFHNNEPVVPKTLAATQFPGQRNYLKMGLYRDASITADGVVFHDGLIQATTLEDVLPSAGNGDRDSSDALSAGAAGSGGPALDKGAGCSAAGSPSMMLVFSALTALFWGGLAGRRR